MNKGRLSFALAGILFGFLAGFLVARQMYAGRDAGFTHPPVSPELTAGPLSGSVAGSPGGAPSREEGGARMAMENVSREIAGLKELLEQDPENLMALVRLGNLYFDAGMFDGARQYYERALRLEPENVDVRTALGESLRNLERPREALEQFEQAVRAQPDYWRGWFNVGVVALYDLGEFEKARAAFEKVAEIKPGTVDMQALLKEIERIRAEKAAGSGSP